MEGGEGHRAAMWRVMWVGGRATMNIDVGACLDDAAANPRRGDSEQIRATNVVRCDPT